MRVSLKKCFIVQRRGYFSNIHFVFKAFMTNQHLEYPQPIIHLAASKVGFSPLVEKIDYELFLSFQEMKEIVIHSKIISIDEEALKDFFSSSSIIVDPDNEFFASIDGVLFSKDKTKLIRYPPQRQSLNYTIPSTVTSLSAYSFLNCTNLNKIQIPSSVTTIDESSFGHNINLQNILVDPSNPNYASIDGILFTRDGTTLINYPSCKKSPQYTIPSRTTTIGSFAFYYDLYLMKIIIPASVKSIGDTSFVVGNRLTKLVVDPDNPFFTSIDGVIYTKNIDTLVCLPHNTFRTVFSIPSTVVSIASYACYNCHRLHVVHIPPSVKSIGKHAFSHCPNLNLDFPPGRESVLKTEFFCKDAKNNLIIPSTFTSISKNYFPSGVFSSETITITENIKFIDSSFFQLYPARNFYVDPKNPYFTTKDGVLFTKNMKEIVCFPPQNCLSQYSIPEGVEIIRAHAFSNCKLHEIIIPSSVTTIEKSACNSCLSLRRVVYQQSSIKYIGYGAFSACSKMEAITIPDGVEIVESEAFYQCGCKDPKLYIPESVTSIGDSAFSCITGLAEIIVHPNNPNYISINDVLFSKDGKKLILYPASKEDSVYHIPMGVTTIGSYAFYLSVGLAKVVIPEGVTHIEHSAFESCTQLSEIIFPSTLQFIGQLAFSDLNELKSISISVSSSELYLEASAFQSNLALKTVEISGNLKSIPESAFSYCNSLDIFAIPSTVTCIGDLAFGNTNFRSIIIPPNLTSIGQNVFHDTSQLENIFVDPSNPEYVSLDGVLFTKDLHTIIRYPSNKPGNTYEIPSTVTQIDTCAFYECVNLTNIIIPSSVTSILNAAFANCDHLTSITIPASVTFLGTSIFSFCSNLEKVHFLCQLTDISCMMFSQCNSLVSIESPSSQSVEIVHNSQSMPFVIPQGVISIDENAFSMPGEIKSIFIPSSVLSIGTYALSDFEAIHVDPNNPCYTSVDGVLFSKNREDLITYPRLKQNPHYSVPEGVKSLLPDLFCQCNYLRSLIIPSSVRIISRGALSRISTLTSIAILAKECNLAYDQLQTNLNLSSISLPNIKEQTTILQIKKLLANLNSEITLF